MNNEYYTSRLRAGDKSVFSELFTEFYQPLCNYAYTILGDRDAAKDVTMDIFTKLCGEPVFWSKIENVRSYLFISMKNRCLETIRKNKHFVSAIDFESELLNIGTTPETYLMQDQRDLRDTLEFLLSKLPRKRREVFRMYCLEDMTYTELAASLGLASGPNTVKTHISLAKQSLLKWRHLLRFIPLPLILFL